MEGTLHRADHKHYYLGVTWFLMLALAIGFTPSAGAEPYLPRDDDEVLETLPRVLFHAKDELSQMRRQLAEDPGNPDLAVTLAASYLQIGKRENDPRFYGYARSALKPWWDQAQAPPAIIKLRAKLKERDHQYDQALADLQRVVQDQPRDVQAWIEMSNLYWVQGRYEKTREVCDHLSGFAGSLPVLLCRIPLMAVTGEAAEAYDLLTKMLPVTRENDPSLVQWVLTMQAVTAEALGRGDLAERLFREGLANEPGDHYLMRAYADFLLDHDREQEVLTLIEGQLADTGLMLRGAIAARRTQQTALATEWRQQLEARFEEIRLRGSLPHGRYESRFMLELEDDPERALNVALANWKLQKQARDTRNVLEAAVAAKNPRAARPVLEFLSKHNTQDVALEKLAAQLRQP